jgi:uncharacterized membrane protein (UPF0127 family)
MDFRRLNKKAILFLFITLVILVFAATFFVKNAIAPVSGSYLVINGHQVAVEVADTPEKQIRGLSNHAPLNDDQGMLFVFPDKQLRTFWMKKMLFPLDIIWIDDDRIVKISGDLPPEGLNPKKIYDSGKPINYVLEVNAGWAMRNGIKIGDSVTIKY